MIMKTLEQLKAELETAKEQVWNIERQIREIADGFTYHICILSYGSARWSTCTNPYDIQEICTEYGDGYDGLVKVYTDNPKLEIEHYGCLEVRTLEQLPDSKKDVSMSQAMSYFAMEFNQK